MKKGEITMSINKTLTISEQDESLWSEVERLSGERMELTISNLLKAKLEQLTEAEKARAGNFSKLTVSYTDDEGYNHKVSFVGRWLLQDHCEGNQTFSVALTEKERLFVLIESPDGDHHIIFDTFSEMCTDQFSDDLLVRIANLIGEEYEEELDI